MRCILFFVFTLSFNYINTQFVTVGTTSTRLKTSKPTCENSSKSTLVENFFNIIFSEFHDTPPVCVCVQMCSDQATYCFPNGCLKKMDANRKPELPVVPLIANTKSALFLQDKPDFINDFMNKNYLGENKAVFVSVPLKQSNIMPINLRPDLFKDKYKFLFKYKKMPKVELKYNLGEQVKNMKEEAIKKENLEVSKTRWPRNKIHHHFSGQRVHTDSITNQGSRFFLSTFPGKEVISNPLKYFKRELTNDTDDVDLKTVLVAGKSDSLNTGSIFSLENLIDSLIENSFESNKTSDVDIESNNNVINVTDYETIETVTEEIETAKNLNKTISQPIFEQAISNTTTGIISVNYTYENIDKNKNNNTKFNEGNSTNHFGDIIASLSKRIDTQNNTSLEMMRWLGNELDFNLTTSTEKHIEATSTTESTVIIKTTKKSRQRLAKKPLYSKNN